MSVWNSLYTVAFAVSLCVVTVITLCCLWPAGPPRRPAPHSPVPAHRAHHRTTSAPRSTAWTCALPKPPLDLDAAHAVMRHHRGHDCPRKRAAFAALVAYGCLVPDSTRRPYRQRVRP